MRVFMLTVLAAALLVWAPVGSADQLDDVIARGLNSQDPGVRERTTLLMAIGAKAAEVKGNFLHGLLYHRKIPNAVFWTRVMLFQGEDPNERNALHGYTPVHLAACLHAPDVLATLLDGGGKAGLGDKRGDTALHLASRYGKTANIELLLAVGAKVNARSSDGFTPLHWAATEGHPAAVKALLIAGADPFARALGLTPLHGAKSQINRTEGDVRGHYEVIRILTDVERSILRGYRGR